MSLRVKVLPHVAGDQPITREFLVERLGEGPFLTWQRLLLCRDVNGITFTTRENVARSISHYVKSTKETRVYSPEAVKEHILRLREVRLSVPQGFHWHQLEDGSFVRRYFQVIFGEVVEAKARFTVPTHAFERLNARVSTRRGGAQKGAGRPAGQKNQKPPLEESKTPTRTESKTPTRNQKPPLDGIQKPPLENQKPPLENQKPPLELIKNPHLVKALTETHEDDRSFASQKNGPSLRSGPPVSPEVEEAGRGEGVSTSPPAGETPAPATPNQDTPPGVQNGPATAFSLPPLTQDSPQASAPQGEAARAPRRFPSSISHIGNPNGRPNPTWGECGMPRYPSGLAYTFPPPPAVPMRYEDDAAGGIDFMARWHTAALRSRYPNAPSMRPGGPARARWELALEICLREEIRPGAWVAYSIDEWRALHPMMALTRPPDGKFVWGERMQSMLHAYRNMEGEYAPNQERFTSDARDILDRLHLVKGLAAPLKWDEAAIRKLVDQHFPKGFDREVSAARRTTETAQEAIRHAVRSGQWIWGADFAGKKAKAIRARMERSREGTNG